MSSPSIISVGVVLLASLACGGGGARSDGGASDGAAAGMLPGAPGVWTWVDVPGMTCDDGTPTGVAINPAPGGTAGGDLLV